MESFTVGDLVRDKLNEGEGNYGLGVVLTGPRPQEKTLENQLAGTFVYDVYFNKFERTITFHGDYLEKV